MTDNWLITEFKDNINTIVREAYKSMTSCRSNKKTNILHYIFNNNIILWLWKNQLQFHKNYELLTETNFWSSSTSKIRIKDIFNNNFAIDWALKNKNNWKLEYVFLLKSAISSINKNRYNSFNSLVGEMNRFYWNEENKDIKLVFVNILPNNTFIFNWEIGEIKIEKVNTLKLQDNINKLIIKDQLKENIFECNIYYDFNEDFLWLKNKKNIIDYLYDNSDINIIKKVDISEFINLIQNIKQQLN